AAARPAVRSTAADIHATIAATTNRRTGVPFTVCTASLTAPLVFNGTATVPGVRHWQLPGTDRGWQRSRYTLHLSRPGRERPRRSRRTLSPSFLSAHQPARR